jgi:APA family basic amino acid/polyamine antiporter
MSLPAPQAELRRELTLLDATMVNVGTMIGSAIFIVPATTAAYTQSSLLCVGVWLGAGLVSLLGALSVAELSAAMPRAGGQYVYLEKAYGPSWGFLYGWTAFMVINTASIAAISVGFATYLGYFLQLDEFGLQTAAIASTVALTTLNCFGLKVGAWTQNVLTLVKMGALLALPLLSFTLPGGSSENLFPFFPSGTFSTLVGPLTLAMVGALWAYDGWIEITYVAGEVKDPGTALPRSIIYSTLVVMLLYTAVSLSCVYVLGVGEMSSSGLVASDVATVILGSSGAALVAGAILVSTLGSNNGIVFTAARIPYAMAREGLFFRFLGSVSPTFETPTAALVIQGILACLLTLSGTYDRLYTYVVFASWVFYAMSCGAVIILRKKAPDLPRPYKAWGYPLVPLAFILSAFVLVAYTIAEDPVASGIGGGIILAGVPVYLYWKRKQQ